MTDNEFEPLVQAWCGELLPAVRQAWGLQLAELPVRVRAGCALNVSIEGTREVPHIAVTETMLHTLGTFNANLFAMGWQMLFCDDVMLRASQPLMNDLLGRVIAMDPPHTPAPQLEQRFTRPGFDDWRDSYESAARERLGQRGTELLVQMAGDDGDAARAARSLEWVAQRLADPKARFQLLECQMKFLLLHELAHLQLGHLGQPTCMQSELDADRLGADVYLECSRASREAGHAVIDTPALVLLYSALGLIEDLMLLTDRSIDYAIPEFARQAHRRLLYSHPDTRHRAATTLGRLAVQDWAHLVAYVTEVALAEMKHQFRLGVIDTRRFKWYCRVRALELQAQWGTMAQPKGASRQAFAARIDNESGWDTQDLQWGPLVDEIFGAQWSESVSMLKSNVH